MSRDLLGRKLTPDPPRRLTPTEARMLTLSGFPEVALRLAAPCEVCGFSVTGTTHRMRCNEFGWVERPEPVVESVSQPWEVKRSRYAA